MLINLGGKGWEKRGGKGGNPEKGYYCSNIIRGNFWRKIRGKLG